MYLYKQESFPYRLSIYNYKILNAKIELLPELMAQEPRLDEAHDRIICIDNIPKVGTDKKDKLKKILQNLIGTYGKIANEFYPEGDDGVLKGYVFVEYENGAAATEACAQLNGYRLDKAHSFKCNFVADYDKYKQMNVSADAQLDMTPLAYKNPGNLHWYLTSGDAFDQFCLLHGDMFTSVFQNTRNQPTVLESREVCRALILMNKKGQTGNTEKICIG